MIKYIFLLNILLLLSGCNVSGLIKVSGKSVDQLKSPDAPTSLSLVSPSSSIGMDTSPTIKVEGVKSGHLIKLFTDSQCVSMVASAYASDSSIELTTTLLIPGNFTFYANATDQDLKSSQCSSAYASLTIYSSPSLAYSDISGTKGVSLLVTPSTLIENFSPISSCTVQPALPVGLSINNQTCVISGSSQVALPSTTYTVSALNAAGPATTTFNLEIIDTQPIVTTGVPSLSYSSSNSGSVGTNLNLNPTTLSANGYAITSCTISPALPVTLSIHNTTCVITGTPSLTQSSTPYVVTVSNSAGASTASLNLTITPSAPVISYAGSNGTSGKTSEPINVIPSTLDNRGASITACTSSPSLPAGLSLNASTCVISGNPTVVVNATSFTITATNSSGSSTANVSLTIIDGTPTAPTSIALDNDVSPTTDTTPTLQVGGVASGQTIRLFTDPNCSTQVAFAVASGPTINLTTSALTIGTKNFYATASSGTPVLTSACSSATAALLIHAPPTISYAASSGTSSLVGVALDVTPSNLTNNGSVITSCLISPALPSGVTLNATSCKLTGTPDSVLSATQYTVTATNAAGSSTAAVTLQITANTPTITFPGAPSTVGITDILMKLAPSTLNARGSAITSCTIAQPLPVGFSINNTTCAISGTPLAVMSPTTFTVTVTNAIGSTSTNVTLQVRANPCPSNYLYMPSNILAGTTSEFCVAKYEMKLISGVATSQAAGDPQVYIAQVDSKLKCEELNSINGVLNKYDLISNQEWMTIALDVENQSLNWTNNAVGSGMMYVGHSDGAPNNVIAITDETNPWILTGNSSMDAVTLGKEQRRTLHLSTGQIIWDFSGNAWEWVDWSLGGNLTQGPGTCVEAWTELPVVSCAELAPIDYMPGNPASIGSDAYNSTYGVGQFYGGIGTAASRGGGYYNRIARVGPFSLDLDYQPTTTLPSRGYRCVFRP